MRKIIFHYARSKKLSIPDQLTEFFVRRRRHIINEHIITLFPYHAHDKIHERQIFYTSFRDDRFK